MQILLSGDVGNDNERLLYESVAEEQFVESPVETGEPTSLLVASISLATLRSSS